MGIFLLKYVELGTEHLSWKEKYKTTGSVIILNHGITADTVRSLIEELKGKIATANAPDPVYIGELMHMLKHEVTERKIGTMHMIGAISIYGVK